MSDRFIYTYWGKGPGKNSKSFHLGIEEKKSGKGIGDFRVYLIVGD